MLYAMIICVLSMGRQISSQKDQKDGMKLGNRGCSGTGRRFFADRVDCSSELLDDTITFSIFNPLFVYYSHRSAFEIKATSGPQEVALGITHFCLPGAMSTQ